MEEIQTLEMYDGEITTRIVYDKRNMYSLEVGQVENNEAVLLTLEEAIELRNFLNEVLQ